MKNGSRDDGLAYEANRELNGRIQDLFHAPLESGEMQFDIPESNGTGSCRRIRLHEAMELHINDITLREPTRIEGRTAGPVLSLALCLADAMSWEQQDDTPASYRIGSGEGLLYALRRQTIERGDYEAGRRYKGLSILMKPSATARCCAAAVCRTICHRSCKRRPGESRTETALSFLWKSG